MIVVFIVVLVVFGPQKLPELARSLGKLMAEFRKASTDFKSAFEEEMRDMERQTLLAERKKAAEAAAASAAATPASEPAPSDSTPSADTAPVENSSEEHAPEGPVVAPVPESVARNSDGPSEAAPSEPPIEAGTVSTPQASPQDQQHLV
jgi:sec-independent protein translocase protein TatB